jgi:hypothetical protein
MIEQGRFEEIVNNFANVDPLLVVGGCWCR